MSNQITLKPGESTHFTAPEIMVNGQVVAAGQDVTVTAAQPAPTPTPSKKLWGLAADTNARSRAAYTSSILGVEKLLSTDAGHPVKAPIHRVYWLQENALSEIDGQIADDVAAGRATFLSIKPLGGGWHGWASTPGDLAKTGNPTRAFYDGLVAILKKYQGHTIYLTFHHEPENDPGDAYQGKVPQSMRDSYKAAHEAVGAFLEHAGVLSWVVFMPIFMAYEFTNQGAQKWGTLDLWLPSKYVPIIGLDCYSESFAACSAFAKKAGKPWMICEFGYAIPQDGTQTDAHRAAQAAYVKDRLAFVNSDPTCLGALYWDSSGYTMAQPARKAFLAATGL